MGMQHRSWRRQIKIHPVTTVLIALVVALVVLVTLGGYIFHWGWTGFSGNSTSGKTLWDWLHLLIIPVVLALGGFWLNQIQKGREQRITQQQAELERELTHDNQQETLLQAYIDKMSELLLEKKLRES